MNAITDWFRRQLTNPQVVFLALILIAFFVAISLTGDILAPVFASLTIAYLLEGVVRFLEQRRTPRLLAVLLVFTVFLVFLLLIFFGLMPLLSNQLSRLIQQVPHMLSQGQAVLMQLPERYPEIITSVQVNDVINEIRSEVTGFGQLILSRSIASVVSIITVLIYLFLVPFLVFFFLKDKSKILNWAAAYLPAETHLAETVWADVDRQIGNYIRGKFWEILVIWFVTYMTFSFFNLDYAMLLGVIVGLSVLIPFVGAAVVTLPVALIAWFQFGWGAEFAYVLLAYAVIQAIDGNILVPILFSEVVDLHPVAIIVAILFFGALWGFWGVFFAIPLATLVQAVLAAWPKSRAA